MNQSCTVALAERNHDLNPIQEREQRAEKFCKRQEVLLQAERWLDGAPVKVVLNDRKQTLDDVLSELQNHDLYKPAALAAYKGDPKPIRDLMRRCANWMVCEYLFEGEAEALGFSQ